MDYRSRLMLTVALALSITALVGLAGINFYLEPPADDLDERWSVDGGTDYPDNHHRMAVVEGTDPLVIIPINGLTGTDQCSLLALDAAGEIAWRVPFAPDSCSPHGIGDVSIVQRTGSTAPTATVATEARLVIGVDVESGEDRTLGSIDAMGYSAPRYLAGVGLIVADFEGTVTAFDDSVAWTATVPNFVWAEPIVVTTDAGEAITVVGAGPSGGAIVQFDDTGVERWNTSIDAPATSWTFAPEPTDRLVVASRDRTISAVDAHSGESLWTTPIDVPDGNIGTIDGDHVIVSTGQGTVIAINHHDGSIGWTTAIADPDVRLQPAVAGDVTGNGVDELVVVGSDGSITVLDSDGTIRAQQVVDARFNAPPVIMHEPGGEQSIIVVLSGDGRIMAFEDPASNE